MVTRCVVDTNVLVAGLRSKRGASHRLLELIASGRVRPVVSVPLVIEYESVLKRQADALGLSDDEVDALVDDLCMTGEPQPIYFLWRPILQDPRDEFLLELAVGAGCAPIVTHNVRDFVGSEALGVRIVTPRQLLHEIGEEP